MKQFLYISLLCGVIAGAGVFLNMPHYPSLMIPRLVAMIGVLVQLSRFEIKKAVPCYL